MLYRQIRSQEHPQMSWMRIRCFDAKFTSSLAPWNGFAAEVGRTKRRRVVGSKAMETSGRRSSSLRLGDGTRTLKAGNPRPVSRLPYTWRRFRKPGRRLLQKAGASLDRRRSGLRCAVNSEAVVGF